MPAKVDFGHPRQVVSSVKVCLVHRYMIAGWFTMVEVYFMSVNLLVLNPS